MDEFEKMRWPAGVKRTKQRELVLSVFSVLDRPLTALEVSEYLAHEGTPVWLSTVYRVLDMFLERGMVSKIAAHENGMAIYALNDGHRHYAVCVTCKKVIAMRGCPLESFMPDLQEKNFRVLGHRLQMYGYCANCGDSGDH